jgi:hypothetical protein
LIPVVALNSLVFSEFVLGVLDLSLTKRVPAPHCRETQSVVLGVAGHWREPHPCIDDRVAQPPAGWLEPGSAKAADLDDGNADMKLVAGPEGGNEWLHSSSLEAAQALLVALASSGLQLNTSEPGGTLDDSSAPQGGLPAAKVPALNLPDCRGWRLVLAGHGLGAGAAAMLALRLRWQHPGKLSAFFSLSSHARVVATEGQPRPSSACALHQQVLGVCCLY